MRVMVSLCLVMLLAGMFFAQPAAGQTWVLVNSKSHADVISGAVYSAEKGYSYAFALTPEHADYLVEFVKSSASPVIYYGSDNPVSSTMGQKLLALNKANFVINTGSDLSSQFAAMGGQDAVIVGMADGSEAISIAPYANLVGAGLYFATPENVDSKISFLKAEGKTVIVYGTIASSASKQGMAGLKVINTGSRYSDNLEALKMYWAKSPSDRIMFASGRAFERSMVSMPVALVGRTEISQDLINWVRSSGATRAWVIQGDADIKGAIASLKQMTNMAVIGTLGIGFTNNAEVQPLAVMAVPTPNALLEMSTVVYHDATRSFTVGIKNIGTYTSYARVAVVLPNGMSGSSQLATIEPGKAKQFTIQLGANKYVSSGEIANALVQVSSSTTPTMVEAIDALNVSKIKVDYAPVAVPSPEYTDSAPSPIGSTESGNAGGIEWGVIGILLLVFVAGAYLLTRGTPAPVKEAKPAQKLAAKKGKGKRKK